MAALNTLRTKGSILLTVVIGISLLAFLLGDGTSLFNKNTNDVGTVNGEKISYKSYSTEVDLLTNVRQYMTNQTSLSTEETDMVLNQVWNKMVSDIILLPVYKSLGFTISDDELLDMVNGTYVSPIVMQIFTDPNSGNFDKERVTEYVANLDADQTGRARQFWSYIEGQISDSRMSEKYNNLVKEGMYVTSLQVDQAVSCNQDDYTIEYVTKSLSSIADDAVKVTDADLREYYTKHNKRFEFATSSEVEYVTFDITPSEQDFKDAEENAMTVATELRESNDVEQYVSYTSETKFDSRYYKQEELPAYINSAIAEASVGTTFEPHFENNIYNIARVTDIKVIPDSVELRSVYVDAKKNIDSIKNIINAGGFDQIVSTLSLTGDAASSEAVKVSTGDLAPQFTEKVFAAKKGDVLTFDVNGAKQLLYVVSLGQPAKKYQVGQIILTVVPSSTTEQIAYAKATAFINEVNSGKSFDETISAHQYIKRTAKVTTADRKFAEMENSRELVRWSFTSKVGALSHVLTIGNVNIVAHLKNTFEKGPAPFESVKEEIRPLYIAKAKMDMAVKELSGASSLESLATKENTTVGTASDVKFSTMNIPGIGIAPELVGAITSLKEGVISQGIPAGNAAAAVKITSKIKNEGIDAAKMKVLLESTATSYLDMRIGAAISSMSDVNDKRVINY